jgi:SAM-dependent methyltransferase
MDFSEASNMGPTTRWRSRMALELLGIPEDNAGVRLLEIGSGRGEFAEMFMGRHPRAVFLGLELSAAGVELASRRAPGAQFVQRDLTVPRPPNHATGFHATHALCSEVLEHVDNPALLLHHAAEYMAPGCRVVVTVPGGPWNVFDRHIGHRRHYTPGDLRELLGSCGFEVEAHRGVGFPFFNLYRLALIARGEKLIGDVSGSPSLLVRLGTAVFDCLFHFNFGRRWGWQTVAVARYRPERKP